MAILEDLKWNIAHIQNSFIIDPSGTCDTAIHARDQLTASEIADRRETDEFYDSSPEIRLPIFAFGNPTRIRSNTDRLLQEVTTRKNSSRTKSTDDVIVESFVKTSGPISSEEIRNRLQSRVKISDEIRQKIVEELPEDTRPFASYKRYEATNSELNSKTYNISLYKKTASKLKRLKFSAKSGKDSEAVQTQMKKIRINEETKYKHLVGLACFHYSTGAIPPEIPLSYDEIGEGTHCLFMIENDKIETDWKISLEQNVKETFFDIASLRTCGLFNI